MRTLMMSKENTIDETSGVELLFSFHKKTGTDDIWWFLYTHLKIMKANRILLSKFYLQLPSTNDVPHNLLHGNIFLFVELHSPEDNSVVLHLDPSNKDIDSKYRILQPLASQTLL